MTGGRQGSHLSHLFTYVAKHDNAISSPLSSFKKKVDLTGFEFPLPIPPVNQAVSTVLALYANNNKKTGIYKKQQVLVRRYKD